MCVHVYLFTALPPHMHIHVYTHMYTLVLSTENVKNQRYLRSKKIQILVLKKNPILIDYRFEVWGDDIFSFVLFFFSILLWQFEIFCSSV